MKKTLIWVFAALMMIMAVEMAFAESAVPAAEEAVIPEAAAADPYAAERERVIAVVQAQMPDAEIDYAVRDRDDGRYEWNVFFRQNGVLGEAKVLEEGFELRKVELFNQSRADSLNAKQAMTKLVLDKGEMTIVDLGLDWDDGRLSYEGEAEMNGKRYEFEITVDGVVVEWERD